MKSSLFAIVLERGASWRNGVPLEEQNLGFHRNYLRELAAQGVVIAAGPFRQADGGLIIVRAENAARAQQIMHDDPGVLDGIFSGTVMEWAVLIDPDGLLRD